MDLEYVCLRRTQDGLTEVNNWPEMLRISIPMLLGFSLGVPILVYALVRCRCKFVPKTTWIEVEDIMSFLYKGLVDEHKYWEAINLMRKALQAVAATVMAPLGPTA